MPARVLVFSFIFLFFVFGNASAQSGRTPQPTPTPPDDTVKVYTEEVRLPVVALDEYERFDPTLVVDDVLVLEDGVPQQVKSVQRIPANVLFLLGTGGETNPAMRTSMTQLTALKVLSKLRQGDNFAVIQFNSKVEKLLDWTGDIKAAANVIKTKMKSANGTRMTEAFEAAFEVFANQPFGNRHIVLITDGIEMPGGRLKYDDKMKALALFQMQENQKAWEDAVKKLNETQATIHIISYTAFAREVFSGNSKKNRPTFGTRRSTANDSIAGTIDPTVPPGTQRGSTLTPTMGISITFDPQMRKLRKAYEKATKTSEKRLTSLAEETGTKILLPTSDDEMLEQVNVIARDIGAQYVVTYTPKKPITSANIGEYRRIIVNPRRIGLTLRTRRGYFVVPPPSKE
jgi:VWFA-related protein